MVDFTIYTQLFLVKLKSVVDGPILHSKSVVDGPFQYGPVIKLPLHISQCHMVNHMALTNAKRLLNIDQSDNFDTTISQVFW